MNPTSNITERPLGTPCRSKIIIFPDEEKIDRSPPGDKVDSEDSVIVTVDDCTDDEDFDSSYDTPRPSEAPGGTADIQPDGTADANPDGTKSCCQLGKDAAKKITACLHMPATQMAGRQCQPQIEVPSDRCLRRLGYLSSVGGVVGGMALAGYLFNKALDEEDKYNGNPLPYSAGGFLVFTATFCVMLRLICIAGVYRPRSETS